MSTLAPSFESLLDAAHRISKEVSALHANDVDVKGRFPRESVEAMRQAKLMSAPVPRELGGSGCSMRQLAQIVSALAPGCASAAMVLTMHYSQVACLMRNTGGNPTLLQRVRELCEHQHLIASITSEVGTFGDTRSSICAVEKSGDSYRLNKDATTGSYCADADVILVTCRKAADAAANDQCLVYNRRADLTLEQTSTWDTLGMRGTCSPGYKFSATGPIDHVLPVDYAEISAASMVPYSHILWSALWMGIAAGAYGKAAQYVRTLARKNPGTVPPQALPLAELNTRLQVIRQQIMAIADEYDGFVAAGDKVESYSSLSWALRMNNLKISTSEATPQIVIAALQIVGIQGYKNDGPYAMGRPLRDALSGSLMVSNDRIAAKSAALLLVHKDD